jgi:hypothetical protein
MGKRVKLTAIKAPVNEKVTAEGIKQMVEKCLESKMNLNLILELLKYLNVRPRFHTLDGSNECD